MTIEQFTASLSEAAPPAGIDAVLAGLWHDAKGDFDAAHAVAQNGEGTAACDRLHAYLHRKEGDAGNAGYWYRRAKAAVFTGSLDDEWRALVAAHLG